MALKVLALPEEPKTGGEAARRALQASVQEVANDYIREVEVCCEMVHPNLVRPLGYATKPRLYLLQELMLGSSLDKQLYVEQWEPTTKQQLKVASDVANGLHYLHTNYEKPLIHRDLKSANLLLLKPPPARDGPDAEDLSLIHI